MPSVVTANNLRTGLVVYLGPGARWVRDLRDASIAVDASDLATLEAQALAAVASTEVTAVYAMDIRIVDGKPEPVSVRERIRAAQSATV
jgi:sulfite reductase (NADPH) hemoprotein beta-component